ncbi:MAG: hypothetical protein JSR58_07030 [Verrucomicrobia bacterium]|nr:hypothetical protein [Verrucomicrobiota bacterium]
MKKLFLLLIITSCLNAFCVKDRIASGKAGDYVVFAQGRMAAALLLRATSQTTLTLEEITIPLTESEGKNWKAWIENKAPGHTSWTSYTIDLKKNQVLECYSHSRKAWMATSDPSQFLTKLLGLHLQTTPADKRKRIGPPPAADEPDRRSLWLPPVSIEGKKINNPSVSVWNGKWPHDETLLSDCTIEVYFGEFAFPYWIEVKSPHYTASMRTLDSGRNLMSPMPPTPQAQLESFFNKRVP